MGLFRNRGSYGRSSLFSRRDTGYGRGNYGRSSLFSRRDTGYGREDDGSDYWEDSLISGIGKKIKGRKEKTADEVEFENASYDGAAAVGTYLSVEDPDKDVLHYAVAGRTEPALRI